jgi:hypothetical protein
VGFSVPLEAPKDAAISLLTEIELAVCTERPELSRGATFHVDWIVEESVVCISCVNGRATASTREMRCSSCDVAIRSSIVDCHRYFLLQSPFVDLWPSIHVDGSIEHLMCFSGYFEMGEA